LAGWGGCASPTDGRDSLSGLPPDDGADSVGDTSDGEDEHDEDDGDDDPPLRFDAGVKLDDGSADGGCDGDGGAELDFTYIWIANSGEAVGNGVSGTISKIDTRLLTEDGRYYTRDDQLGSPSRTSVNLSGDVAVVNRQGGVTKFYARPDDCEDTNGMPGIQTSTGKNDVLPWAEEECRAWYTQLDYDVMRPAAWAPGEWNEATCRDEGAKFWTTGAYYNQSDSVVALRLNGDDGTVDDVVPIPEVPLDQFGPYGGAVDSEGSFYFISRGSQLPPPYVVRVDAETLDYQVWQAEVSPYGMTVDSKGRVWLGGVNGIARFDWQNETWDVLQAVDFGDPRGMGVQQGPDGLMWFGKNPYAPPYGCGVFSLDADTMQFGPAYVVPAKDDICKGVSIDFDGYVWVVDMVDSAWKLDRETGDWDVYSGLNSPYTYSDMTGWGLLNAGGPEG
jgi:hypothetical protein